MHAGLLLVYVVLILSVGRSSSSFRGQNCTEPTKEHEKHNQIKPSKVLPKQFAIQLVEELWILEQRSLNQTKECKLNFQEQWNKSDPKNDQSPGPLFRNFDEAALVNKMDILQSYIHLLRIYKELELKAIASKKSMEYHQEVKEFFYQLRRTDIWQEAAHSIANYDQRYKCGDFPHLFMDRLWFRLERYQSGLENTFVGHMQHDDLPNNWIQLGCLEARKKLNYLGYITKLCGDPPLLATVVFDIVDETPVPCNTTILIGTSPQFELAMYTILYLTGDQEMTVQLGSCRVTASCELSSNGIYIKRCFVK
ncbi:hypothetical protein CRM22_005407 [Opisthorchis felineus]|uniref:Uridylate-specific endoribonuclease n=1 Tax=Opisthorchis felineus TaxID=147828 RepID=A0A4S2LRA8_OPIFE|nr:hypothetical protein CRM22_005407 [Opisthorchis felineus]